MQKLMSSIAVTYDTSGEFPKANGVNCILKI